MRTLKIAVVLLCLLSAIPVSAQVLYGSLTGNVADATGAALPNARIEARNSNTGITRQTTSDERGLYLFNDLQPGSYDISIGATSFSSVVEKAVSINANTVRRLDVSMQLATVAESVIVTGSAATLQTDRADINTQLQTSQVTNLPVAAGRNFQQLFKIVPGFSTPADAHSDAGNPQRALVSNVNGMSYSNNNTRLDGATVSYPWLPHIVAYVPPADAIETVNIVTNAFDAEQGMAGGAAVNVTIKSGTNEFHGSAHEFHTNSFMKARNYFFLGDTNPKNIFNQFGGTIGGPIVRNKLFFFADWERTTRRQNASPFRTVPNAPLRTGNFNGSGTIIYDPRTGSVDGSGRQPFPNNQIPADRIDPASLKMIALIPEPNLTTFPQNYFASATYEFTRDNSDFKVNYNPTDKSSLFVRYSFSPTDIFDPPSLGAAGGDAIAGGQPGRAPGLVQSAAVGGTYTVSPRILVDGNVGYTRQRLSAENIDLDKNYGTDVLNIPGTNGPDRLQAGYPRFTFSQFSSIGNPNVSNPFLFRDNQYVAAGNLSWLTGSHSLRFGGEFTNYQINHFQPQASYGPRGGFNFTGGLTALRGGVAPNLYNSWADFLLGLPNGLGKDLQNINPATVRMPSWGFYARDQWQVTRKLTINYGMRYEFYPFGTRDTRGFERYDPATDQVIIGGVGGNPKDSGVDVGRGQIAPRIGIAYRLGDRTVIRSGYGISIDPNNFRQMRDAYPAIISLQLSGDTPFEAAGSLRTGVPPLIPPDISSGKLVLPAAVGTQTYPTEFRRGYIQSYNLTVQREMGAGFNWQVGYVGARGIRQMTNININSSPINGGNTGRALYGTSRRIGTISQITPFNSSTYNSLQTQLTRRMSAGGVIGITYTLSRAINYNDNSDSGLTWNTPEYWARNKAVAGFDRTHNFQLYGVYDLPFGRGKRFVTGGFLGALAGGWQANWILSRTSGTPFTVGSVGTSLNSQGNTQTADQVVSEVKILGGHGRGESYFDPLAFAPVTTARFGTSGRNVLRGPGVFNLDTSLFRNFNLTERFRVQFRAEAFGVTNTPQFDNPGATVSSATRNPDNSIRALNGYTEITGARGERQFRLALKLFF